MKKSLTKNEKYVEKWFREHGFTYELLKQYNSKTIWNISEGGVESTFELISGVEDIKLYMKRYTETWNMYKELVELRKQANPLRK